MYNTWVNTCNHKDDTRQKLEATSELKLPIMCNFGKKSLKQLIMKMAYLDI